MNYEIIIKEIEAQRVAFTRYHGPVKDANKHFPAIFKSIVGKASSAPFYLYKSMDTESGIADIELCVPTTENPRDESIQIKTLPARKVLYLKHIGGYDKLHIAYESILEYIQSNDIDVDSTWYEVFIKGPGMILKGNPNKYITELIYPFKES